MRLPRVDSRTPIGWHGRSVPHARRRPKSTSNFRFSGLEDFRSSLWLICAKVLLLASCYQEATVDLPLAESPSIGLGKHLGPVNRRKSPTDSLDEGKSKVTHKQKG